VRTVITIPVAIVFLTVMFAFGQASPPPSFQFSSGLAAADIPFDSVADGLVLVSAQVNHHAGWFILDNAAQGFTLDRTFARQIELQSSGSAVARTDTAKTIETTIARDVDISLPGLDLTHRNFVVLDLKDIEPAIGHEVDGIIGSRLFDDFVVVIDYERQRLSIYSPRNFRPPKKAEELPIRVDSHGFQFIEATIVLPGVEPLTASFLIDGGANSFADIYKPFADAHQLPPPGMKLLDQSGTGAGGTSQLRDGRAEQIRIGPYSVKNPPITFTQESEGLMAAKDHAGLIGAEFLRRFTVIFDNAGKRICLAPNPNYGKTAEYDQSGLRLRAEGKGFHRIVVERVIPKSPSAEAGVEVGDVIESIGGRRVEKMTLTEVRETFRAPDVHCVLELLRGNGRIRVTMRLRPLI
jgi:PDZ domain/Aspartyl protease